MKKKIVAAVLVCVLCVGLGIGGTLAWLTDKTDAVTNTFTVGNIQIDLKEHEYISRDDTADKAKIGTLGTAEVKENKDYYFVPGDKLPKDPFVTVKAKSEACYLFVKITETNNTYTGLEGKIVNWTVTPAEINAAQADVTWNKLTSGVEAGSEVWYCVVDEDLAASGASWYILKDNKVSVNENITKVMVENINKAKPMLSFTAYAVQKDNITDVNAAWTQAQTSANY